MSQRESHHGSQSQSLGFNLSQGTFDTMLHSMFSSGSATIPGGFRTEFREEGAPGYPPDQIEFTLERTTFPVTLGPPPYLSDSLIHGQSSQGQAIFGSPVSSQFPSSQPLTVLDALGIPSNAAAPGPRGFRIKFPDEKENLPKSTPWTYSAELNKLFVKLATFCPVAFTTDGTLQPGEAYLRVMPVFKLPQDVKTVIKRCSHHIQKNEDRLANPEHLIGANHKEAQYHVCAVSGRLSVVVPFEPNDHGDAVHLFSFMCFSSCVGSLNRRPCHVIFSLELSGQVIGRQTLDIRICACPGRDKKNELCPTPRKHQEVSTVGITALSQPVCNGVSRVCSGQEVEEQEQSVVLSYSAKRMKIEEDDEEERVYYVPVKGRKNYEIVLKMAEGLALIEHMSQCDPRRLEQFRALLREPTEVPPSEQPSDQSSGGSTSSVNSVDSLTFRLKRTVSGRVKVKDSTRR